MAIACLLITHLPIKVEEFREPLLQGKAVLIYQQSGTQKSILDRSAEAHDVTLGMPLDVALVRCPYAALIEAD